ncbi:metallophosphoesterase [Akkermansiaceae bacterium]|nr:metallophosphoesterase [Akkermansiaceae bacterium]
MADVRSLEADVLICLGGVVCHGPNPQEIYDGNRAVTDHFVLGNHDAPAPPLSQHLRSPQQRPQGHTEKSKSLAVSQ